MLGELWRFIVGVIGYWQAYASGGVVTAIIALGERVTGRSLPKAAYLSVFLVVYLLVAFFLVWRDEYRGARAARKDVVALTESNAEIATRLNHAEGQVRDLATRLASAYSASYTPSLDLVYAEKQFRFYNRGKTNLYFWGTRLADDRPAIESEARVITPSGGGFIGEGFFYIPGDQFEQRERSRLGQDGEERVPLEAFVATEDSKRYRIRYVLRVVMAGGAVTVHSQNMGMKEFDWSSN